MTAPRFQKADNDTRVPPTPFSFCLTDSCETVIHGTGYCPACRTARIEQFLEKRDCAPSPPPFPKGARLTYVGPTLAAARQDGPAYLRRDALITGDVVEVYATFDGEQGTLQQIQGSDGPLFDDSDETQKVPVLDTTRDGVCFFKVNGRHVFGRTIRHVGDRFGGIEKGEFR